MKKGRRLTSISSKSFANCAFALIFRVIRTLFDSCDEEKVGKIHINQLSVLLTKLGKSDGMSLSDALAEYVPLTRTAFR